MAADLTSGPDGQLMTYDERIDEILARYAPTHPVHRAWVTGRVEIGHAVTRAHARLVAAQSTTG
ncbi:MAG: hypothetical protein ACRDQ7_04695 [Haloechinothrix sp.]